MGPLASSPLASPPRRSQHGSMQRLLIILGTLIILAGLAWPWLSKLPLGRLPGDLVIDRPGLKIFFPLTTMIIISLLISFILWLLRR